MHEVDMLQGGLEALGDVLDAGGSLTTAEGKVKRNFGGSKVAAATGARLFLGIKQFGFTWNIFHLKPTSNNSLLRR